MHARARIRRRRLQGESDLVSDADVTNGATRLKNWVIAALGWLVFHLGLHRRLSAGRAVIVLFHRVDDRYPGTPINSTRREFESFLTFFKRFYTVISLGDLLERLRRGDDVSNCLVITFDDGYLDNYRDAAPALARHGLPACFFVVTEFLGSNRVPWWDEELGIQSEWMDWDQLRALHAQGFEIGAHTMSHVDLGVTVGDPAVAEIAGSQEAAGTRTWRADRVLQLSLRPPAPDRGREPQGGPGRRVLVLSVGLRRSRQGRRRPVQAQPYADLALVPFAVPVRVRCGVPPHVKPRCRVGGKAYVRRCRPAPLPRSPPRGSSTRKRSVRRGPHSCSGAA